MTLFYLITRHLGTTNMKIEAIQDEIDENKAYVELYKQNIKKHENEIDHLEYDLEKLRRKSN